MALLQKVLDVLPLNEEKRRFQRGAGGDETFASVFPTDPLEYRRRFLKMFA